MLKKKYKRKHAPNEPDELVELYRNKTFLAKSLSATRVSSVKFSADGQMTTNCEKCDRLSDHHVQANLELPELKERCAITADKELYLLSKQLADSVVDVQAEDAKQAPLYEHKSAMTWENYTKSYDDEGKLKETYYTNDNSSVTVTISANIQPNEPQVAPKSEDKLVKEPAQQRAKKKHKKSKKMKSHSADSTEDSTSVESARVSQHKREIARKLKSATNEQRIMMMDIAKCEAQQEIVKATEQCNPIPSSIVRPVKVLQRMSKIAFEKMDDWYGFSFLLPLGIVIYLVYILFIDVNIYFQEERRYLKKMRSSGPLMKLFYYVMHMLKVRIF